nr:MAG TPA: hypothetical protein [Caudoviricetes sp.]DAT63070.1 MAG TPA: hypothetical protein [Caudoviricetes sp.]
MYFAFHYSTPQGTLWLSLRNTIVERKKKK